MVLKILVLILPVYLAVSVFGTAQVPGFYMREPSRKTEIPFLASNNLIIIPISINGSPAINFLLDTGVKTNLLFSKTIGDQIGLVFTRKLDLVGADGKTVITASVSPNNHMDAGNLEGISQTLLVLDDDFFELEMIIGVPVYGVIGYEFFKYNPVKIDYNTSKITFYDSNVMKWRPLGYKKIPMKVENNKPYINTRVKQVQGEDLDAKLLIDTGANHGLLLNMETSDKIKLPPIYIETELGRSLGGDLSGYVGRVKQLSIDGMKFTNLIASYPDETDYSYVIKETGRQGSLGSEILGRTNMILDYRRERLFLKKGATFNNPFEHDMSGLTVRMYPLDEKRFYVSKIREGSPAAVAGIKLRDEITTINKIPLDFWELSDLVKLFRSEPNREIFLELKRYTDDNLEDFEMLEISFKLKKQI